jgi:uncharacterized protein (DUF169 family)
MKNPNIRIEIVTCDGEKVIFESEDQEFILSIATQAAEKVGYILQPTKRKGGGDG